MFSFARRDAIARLGRRRYLDCARPEGVGGGGAAWTMCKPLAGHLDGRVVYSIGVRDGVDWELAMMGRFGVRVDAWDGRSGAAEWYARTELPEDFGFHEVGLGGRDGMVGMNGSCGVVEEEEGEEKEGGDSERDVLMYGRGRGMRVVTLLTMMRMMGHADMAVLKVEAGRCEVEAMEMWAREERPPPADQVVVEVGARGGAGGREMEEVVCRVVRGFGKLGLELVVRMGSVRFQMWSVLMRVVCEMCEEILTTNMCFGVCCCCCCCC